MNRTTSTALGLALAMALIPSVAGAQRAERLERGERVQRADPEREVVRVRITPEEEVTREAGLERDDAIGDALFTPFGVGLTVGGGYKNFVEPGVTDTLTPGGYWDVRGVFGTRSFVGLEAAYHGSAQDVEAIGLQDEAFLVSNGIEGAVRLNAPITQSIVPMGMDVPILIEPFAFGGVGWQRYTLFNEGANTSDVGNTDDILTLPVGAGLAFSTGGLQLSARAAYRHALFSDLVGEPTSSFGNESLNSWSIGGALGFEF